VAARLLIEGQPPPGWAVWAAAMGEWLAADSGPGPGTVIAASLPTRAWAAAFAAVGACRARARIGSGHTRAEIERWGIGARVRFPFTGAFREGRIKAFGSRGLVIRQPSYLECLVPWARAGGVERLPDGAEPSSRIKRPAPAARFRAAALGTDLASPTDALDCLIIGQKHRLEEELALELGIEGNRYSGTLAELVRPRSLVGQKSQFRSEIISSASGEVPAAGGPGGIPALVTLDGSGAVLRWIAAKWASPVLCLIDRTEPRADDAASAIEAARAGAPGGVDRRTMPNAPDGVETVGFVRAAANA
jgi:hypothetical protein